MRRLRARLAGSSHAAFAARLGWRRERLSALLTGSAWASLPEAFVLAEVAEIAFQSPNRVIIAYLREQLSSLESDEAATRHIGQGPADSTPQTR